MYAGKAPEGQQLYGQVSNSSSAAPRHTEQLSDQALKAAFHSMQECRVKLSHLLIISRDETRAHVFLLLPPPNPNTKTSILLFCTTEHINLQKVAIFTSSPIFTDKK